MPRLLCCYDYIDHVAVQAGPGRSSRFRQWHDDLIGISNMVTVVSEPLEKDMAGRYDQQRVFMVPNGVPSDWVSGRFEGVPRDKLARRPDRMIVGFLGSLFEWVDFELLAEVATRLKEAEFVLVGPTRHGVSPSAVTGLANVRCLPGVPFAEVPAHIQAFDVCLIPFRRDVMSEWADPLKVYEYCALGKPVVSTIAFSSHRRPAPIHVAHGADEFARAIMDARTQDTDDHRARRIAFAKENTWEIRTRELVSAVRQALHIQTSRSKPCADGVARPRATR
jgi:hypothetical protein